MSGVAILSWSALTILGALIATGLAISVVRAVLHLWQHCLSLSLRCGVCGAFTEEARRVRNR